MSILSVHDLQGIAAYQNKIRIPTGNQIDFDGNLKIPVWNNDTRPVSGETGMIGFNTTSKKVEIYDGTKWSPIGGAELGSFANPAPNGIVLRDNGFSTGYYWIQPIGSSDKKYCYVDNTNYGGGWVLVQTVGSASTYHGDRTTEHNLYTTTDNEGNVASSVMFSGTGYSSSDGRRFSDEFVKAVGAFTNGGGEVFNLRLARNGAQPPGGPNDTYAGGTTTDWRYAAFVRYDNGLSNYSSNNHGGGNRPPIDISHAYPFNWETGGSGHYILASNSNYRVFDFHSDPSSIQSSRYGTNRFLWQYPGTGANGIYGGSDSFTGNSNGNPGYMFIR
jgi:hypothetical protein